MTVNASTIEKLNYSPQEEIINGTKVKSGRFV
jgi:hypothetical protein